MKAVTYGYDHASCLVSVQIKRGSSQIKITLFTNNWLSVGTVLSLYV
jgi:hypothetical protein